MTAEEYYQEGNAWRKQGDFKRAQTYVVDAHHLDGMLQMGNGIHDVCLALLAQESMIERSMSHTTIGATAFHF